MQYLEFAVNDVGNLVITLTKDGVTELERLLSSHSEWKDEEVFLELLDEPLTHGWYVIAPDQIRAQSNSVLLSDAVEYDTTGNVTQVGRIYWFPSYEVQGYTQTLLRTGYIIFQQDTSGVDFSLVLKR